MWDAWCARCHAADGSGKVQEPTITVEPMDFTDCKVATPEPDADWELAISHGGPAVGLSSEMPGFGDSLTEQQVRGFVALMRTFCKESGWPHGNTNFPRPIITEKAYPENEFVLLPSIARHQGSADLGVIGVYERRFGRRAMWEIAVPVSSHGTAADGRQQGVGDIEVAAKYVLAAGANRPRILSVGFEVALPTGSRVRTLGRGTAVFEPYLAFGALVGELYLQAQAKGELPVDTGKAGRAFVYNLYVGRDTSSSPNTVTLGVELNGENDELALTPQLRKGLTKTGALAAALGVQLPITQRGARSTRVVAYLLWEYLEPVRAAP
jgi:hypothetical protein